jgi:hypothetical protein
LPSPRSLARLGAVLLLAGCQEQLAAPADCPNLCPGGYHIREDTLFALQDLDSSSVGYVNAGQGSSLLVSWQFPLSEDRAVYKFARRTDSLFINGQNRAYTIDSLALELSLGYRDTLVKGLKLFLYRLPVTVDSTSTFADIDAAFTPASTVDSFLVDDSVVTKRLRAVFSGADTTRLIIPAADSGVLALGVQIRADQGTAVKIGGAGAGSGAPTFTTYVTVPSTDTGTVNRVVTPSVQFNTFVSQTTPTDDPNLLTLGGVPSARALVRFPWSVKLRDSATLVRATLQLIPSTAVTGLGQDSAFVAARPIIADFGGKSPAVNDASFTTIVPVMPGTTDTVSVEVRRALTLWQGTRPVPPALSLSLIPEASSFTRPTFGSTRTPGLVPRIIVTYALKFPFNEP